MTFLAPSAAVIAAALTFPLLLLLYVLKLRRRPLRVSAVQFWTQDVEDLEANVPFRRLRASWMLLLHALVLALLVLALGRPALLGWVDPAARIVIVLDRSASMSARDIPGNTTSSTPAPPTSRLDAAKARAADLIRSSRGGSRTFSIIAFAADASLVLPETKSARAALDAIDSVTPTDQPGDLEAMARLVAGLTAADSITPRETATTDDSTKPSADTERAENAPRPVFIHLFSDGSFPPDNTAAIDGTILYHAIGPLASAAPPSSASSSPIPSAPKLTPPGPDNLGIVALSASRDTAQAADSNRSSASHLVFVRLLNASATPRDVPLSISLDGIPASRSIIHVPARSEATRSEPITAPSGGLILASISAGDTLAADDSAAMTLAPPRTRRILLVRPAPGLGITQRSPAAVDWLRTVLEELPASFVVDLRDTDFAEFLAADRAAPEDIAVFDSVTPAAPPPMPSLSFGAGIPEPGLRLSAKPAPDAPGSPLPEAQHALTWKRTHAVLRDLSLDALVVTSQRTPQSLPGAIPASDTPSVEPLARSANGPLLLAQESGAHRRLVTTFDIADSNWPLLVSFPIFIASAIDFLASEGLPQSDADSGGTLALRTGDLVRVTPAAGAKEITLTPVVTTRAPQATAAGVPPANNSQSPQAATPVPPLTWRVVPARAGPMPLGKLEHAGVYRITGADSPYLAVNLLDARESRLEVRTLISLAGRQVPDQDSPEAAAQQAAEKTPTTPTTPNTPTDPTRGRGAEKEIWPWFVLAAFALLALEWLLFAARARR